MYAGHLAIFPLYFAKSYKVILILMFKYPDIDRTLNVSTGNFAYRDVHKQSS